jgi:hypothetical protein
VSVRRTRQPGADRGELGIDQRATEAPSRRTTQDEVAAVEGRVRSCNAYASAPSTCCRISIGLVRRTLPARRAQRISANVGCAQQPR